MKNPKILIGCPTHDKDSIYLDGFLESINDQDYCDFNILFADTSSNHEFHNVLKKTGAIVIKAKPKKDARMEKIIAGREAIRKYFLKHDYDRLWFVDTDVRPPKNALSTLLSDKKDVVSGVCLGKFKQENEFRVLPCIYKFEKEPGVCRQLNITQVLDNDVDEIAVAGFGCVLIKKEVLEKVKIRQFQEGGGEDAAFFIDSLKAGFKNFVDKRVKCAHLVYEPGNEKNRKFDFKYYKKNK